MARQGETEIVQAHLRVPERNHFFRNRDIERFPQRLLSWHNGQPHYRGLAYQDDDWSDPSTTAYLDGNLTHERILNNTSTTTNAVDYRPSGRHS